MGPAGILALSEGGEGRVDLAPRIPLKLFNCDDRDMEFSACCCKSKVSMSSSFMLITIFSGSLELGSVRSMDAGNE